MNYIAQQLIGHQASFDQIERMLAPRVGSF